MEFFGNQTQNAVISFQKAFGLVPDGIVGPKTWDALMPYINGYTYYTIKNGDSLYSIALYFKTTVNSIIFANPQIDYNNLQIGATIIVPFGNIVPTNISYTSNILEMNLNSMKTIYPFLQISSIGSSNLGKSIPVIKFGNGSKEVLYVGATHANVCVPQLHLFNLLHKYLSMFACFLFQNIV